MSAKHIHTHKTEYGDNKQTIEIFIDRNNNKKIAHILVNAYDVDFISQIGQYVSKANNKHNMYILSYNGKLSANSDFLNFILSH